MIYRTLMFALLTLLMQACASQKTPASNMNDNTDPGMAHTVYFWLKDGLTEQELKSFEAGVSSLSAAPTVRKVFVGKPASTPSRGVVDNSFDYSLVLWFDDVAGHDAYQISPTHLKFVADHEAKFDVVKVFDNVLLH